MVTNVDVYLCFAAVHVLLRRWSRSRTSTGVNFGRATMGWRLPVPLPPHLEWYPVRHQISTETLRRHATSPLYSNVMNPFHVMVVKGTPGSRSFCIAYSAQPPSKEAWCRYASDADLKDQIDQVEPNPVKAAIVKFEIDQGRGRSSSVYSFTIDFDPRKLGFKTHAAAERHR